MNHWNYVFRTCPNIDTLLLPLEEAIRTVILPSITRQDVPNDTLSDLFALPCRLGGLGISNPSSTLLSNIPTLHLCLPL